MSVGFAWLEESSPCTFGAPLARFREGVHQDLFCNAPAPAANHADQHCLMPAGSASLLSSSCVLRRFATFPSCESTPPRPAHILYLHPPGRDRLAPYPQPTICKMAPTTVCVATVRIPRRSSLQRLVSNHHRLFGAARFGFAGPGTARRKYPSTPSWSW